MPYDLILIMKRISIALLLSGCTTVQYWEFDRSEVVYDDADIYFAWVPSSEYAKHCRVASLACAVRCKTISNDSSTPACVTDFIGRKDRWRCVIVSRETKESLAMQTDQYGMNVVQHERKHCKGWNHGY